MANQTIQHIPASQEMIERCLAKAVAEGDIVNFRFMFLPLSPLRSDNTEDINSDKYAYLVPSDQQTSDPAFLEALGLIRQSETWDFIRSQIDKKEGPPQLPASLVLPLADHAVRLGKYTSAAQAYELLRLRRRMRDAFLAQADAALDANDIPKAVRGYRIGSGLSYNYAAFPEPMPAVPNYQTKALLLHALYPQKPEDFIAMQPVEQQVQSILDYLLLDAETAARLDTRSQETKLAFIAELVRQIDPAWDTFRERYRECLIPVRKFNDRIKHLMEVKNQANNNGDSLADEVQVQHDVDTFAQIPELLLGRSIPEGEWWQYLKELAFQHPAAVFFVKRQFISRDLEIIFPPIIKGSPLVKALDLEFES